MKIPAVPKTLVIRVNQIFITLFLVAYLAVMFKPSFLGYDQMKVSSLIVRCSLRECHSNKTEDRIKMKAVLETKVREVRQAKKRVSVIPSFVLEAVRGKKIGLVNMEEVESAAMISEWEKSLGAEAYHVVFDRVSPNMEWKDLFPEWIDEEEENDGPSCPEIPLPDFANYNVEFDTVVTRLPCRRPEEGWARDVSRLQAHLVAANVAAQKGKRDGRGRVRVVLCSSCRPMPELFRCDDIAGGEGEWWMLEPEAGRLEKKVQLPVGSCMLALPLWAHGTNKEYDPSVLLPTVAGRRREAYATVLHSSEGYVCGAIALAQSLLASGTTRDLIILLDNSITMSKRQALAAAGWKIRDIERIRNPRAQKKSYNEYNYSKLRLWQLTDYDKVIFIDADIVVLRNPDILFSFPQISATGNDGVIFNSGVMVIEPSNCTFNMLMDSRTEVISYNGGDQGFLNEVFVWWHRLPRRMNFLKNFWSNTSAEVAVKNELFGADPPKLYAIHYLGLKPWDCYRDYDCNWDLKLQHVFASDIAHRRWWKLHDNMDPKLQSFCTLTERRKVELDWDRQLAKKAGFKDRHWKVKIKDPRRNVQ